MLRPKLRFNSPSGAGISAWLWQRCSYLDRLDYRTSWSFQRQPGQSESIREDELEQIYDSYSWCTYTISFGKFDEFLDCKWIIRVLVWMHFERQSTVCLFNISDLCVIGDSKDLEWVEGLNVFHWLNGVEVEVPDIPEEGGNNTFVNEAFLEDGRAEFSLLDCVKSFTPCTLTWCWKLF